MYEKPRSLFLYAFVRTKFADLAALLRILTSLSGCALLALDDHLPGFSSKSDSAATVAGTQAAAAAEAFAYAFAQLRKRSFDYLRMMEPGCADFSTTVASAIKSV